VDLRQLGRLSAQKAPGIADLLNLEGCLGLEVYNANCEGAPISSATFQVTGNEQYLRVECKDHDGARAWSNPIWVG